MLECAVAAAALIFPYNSPVAQTTTPRAPAITLVEPPAPLLPAHSGGMTADEVSRAAVGDLKPDSFDDASCLPVLSRAGAPAAAQLDSGPRDGHVGNCLAILKEDSLVRLAATRYRMGAVDSGFAVAAFQFDDATGAYSAYTFFRSRMHAVRLSSSDRKALATASESSTGAEGTLIWSGTAVLRTDGRLPASEIATLVGSLPKVNGRKSLAPLLPTFLPGDGLERTDIRYALGPAGYAAMAGVLPAGVIDWSKSAEAATAGYTAHGKGMLTLLLYPTPQIAGIQGREVEKAINTIGQSKFGTVKLRRIGPLVGMTSGGFTAERAETLVHALSLNEQVTFDKPMPLEFHAEVQKTASLLQNIATFVGVLLAAAILLALFLGGARAGIRVMMGKPAASEPEFLTINLRGRQAPLRRTAAEGEAEKLDPPVGLR